MKYLVRLMFALVFTTLFYSSTQACSCAGRSTEEAFIQADFIANARIISMTKKENEKWMHLAKIEIIELFKGDYRDTISVYTAPTPTCGIWTEPGSEWLIIADKWNGQVSFGACSGSRSLVPPVYFKEKSAKNYVWSTERKVKALRLLKEKVTDFSIFDTENTSLKMELEALDEFNGVKLEDEIVGIYMAAFNQQDDLKELKALYEVNKPELTIKLRAVLREELHSFTPDGREEKDENNKVRLITIYCHANKEGSQSFLSRFGL